MSPKGVKEKGVSSPLFLLAPLGVEQEKGVRRGGREGEGVDKGGRNDIKIKGFNIIIKT